MEDKQVLELVMLNIVVVESEALLQLLARVVEAEREIPKTEVIRLSIVQLMEQGVRLEVVMEVTEPQMETQEEVLQ